MNQTLVQVLSKTCLQAQDTKNWDDQLSQALLAIRTMPGDVTGVTPAKLLYGYEVRTPATWPPPRKDYVEGEIQEDLMSRVKVVDFTMREMWQDIQEREERRKRAYKRRYDQLVFPRTFEVGDLVLMKDQVPAGKLEARWIGPMKVVRANRTSTYHLSGSFGGRLKGAVNGDNETMGRTLGDDPGSAVTQRGRTTTTCLSTEVTLGKHSMNGRRRHLGGRHVAPL